MWKKRLWALLVLIIGLGLGFFVYKSEPVDGHVPTRPAFLTNYFERHQKPFKLGLDLSGGTHLVYEADVSELTSAEVPGSMIVLRDLVERRINARQVSGVLGVLDPLVQIKDGGIGSGGAQQLIVDLPGVTDVTTAINSIGETPTLEFKTEGEAAPQEITVDADGNAVIPDGFDPFSNYVSSGLTGRYLDNATVQFDPNTGAPYVSLNFNPEGAELFAKITKASVGKTIAIFLDGVAISAPSVSEEITGGQAVIQGTFTPKEAKALADSLRYGALPVPIKLVSSELIGPSLGAEAIDAGMNAAVIGFLAIALFLLIWYRLPGLVAVVTLMIYIVITLAVFKLLNVTLSAAAIAGFIISIGLAVDANVLIFERIKEELRAGRTVADAIGAGFARAWLSIRDSNFASILTALILFFLFSGSFIKGFAITFLLGVLISLFSSMVITRLMLRAIATKNTGRVTSFLFGSGFTSAKAQNVTTK